MSNYRKYLTLLAVLTVSLVLAACGPRGEVESVEIRDSEGNAITVATVAVDDAVELRAFVRMSTGTVEEAGVTTIWATDDADVATVTSPGNRSTITGESVGMATVTATYRGHSGSVNVTVTPSLESAE